jgi:hypothetical protein
MNTETVNVGWNLIAFTLFLSFASGFVIGATRIVSTFQYTKRLFKTPSFWVFLFLYGFAGTVTFSILALQNEKYWQSPLIALLAGLIPHLFLHSRFTLLRTRDEEGHKKLDVSLDLEKVFNTWVTFVKNRIDVNSMSEHRKIITGLMRKYPTTISMRNEVVKIIYTLQAIDNEERQKKLQEINEIYQSAEGLRDEICLYRLAILALRYSDFDDLLSGLLKESLELEEPSEEVTPREVHSPDPVEGFLKENPNFLQEIGQWREKLTKEEWDYLQKEVIQNSELTDRGKAKAAAKFLSKRGGFQTTSEQMKKEDTPFIAKAEDGSV